MHTLVPAAIIIFIIAIGVVLLNLHFQKNLSLQKYQQEALKSKHQQELFRSGIHAQEEERKRIAQDLHDELGSMLSIMRMQLLILEQQEFSEELKNIRQLSETAMTSVRSISHQLMPPQLEVFGLAATLESVIARSEQLDIQLNCNFVQEELSWMQTLGLYRILMELLNNTMKHAGATLVTIEIWQEETPRHCHYSDNGHGLPADIAGKGLGLKSIEARVNALAGSVKMGNQPGSGFYAIIRLPMFA